MKSLSLLWALSSIVLLVNGCGGSGSNSTGGTPSWLTTQELSNGNYVYTPSGIQAAYQITSNLGEGQGQTIAIIDRIGNPNIQGDLAAFSTAFGLPQANLTIQYMQGQPTYNNATCNFSVRTTNGFQNICAAWTSETALDVEMVHAIAPQANILLVFEGAQTEDSTVAAVDYAVAQGANVVTMSFSYYEFPSEDTLYDSHFNIPGVTFVASSGDAGDTVNWPAVSQYVLAVGGTHLQYNPSTESRSETAWPKSGGGISQFVTIPSYQQNVGGDASTTYRSVPDVAIVADSATGVFVYDSTNGPYVNGFGSGWVNGVPAQSPLTDLNWVISSGASVGSPMWAGLIALANGKRASSSPLGDVHAAIYAAPSSDFNDITSGCVFSGFCAGVGFDLLTGLGTPVANQLINYLINY